MRFLGCVSARGGNNVVCSFEKFLVPVSGVSSVFVRPRGPPALCSVPLCSRCCAPRTGAVLYTGRVAAIRTRQEFVQPVCCLVLSAAGQMGGTRYHPVKGDGPVYQSCATNAQILPVYSSPQGEPERIWESAAAFQDFKRVLCSFERS